MTENWGHSWNKMCVCVWYNLLTSGNNQMLHINSVISFLRLSRINVEQTTPKNIELDANISLTKWLMIKHEMIFLYSCENILRKKMAKSWRHQIKENFFCSFSFFHLKIFNLERYLRKTWHPKIHWLTSHTFTLSKTDVGN